MFDRVQIVFLITVDSFDNGLLGYGRFFSITKLCSMPQWIEVFSYVFIVSTPILIYVFLVSTQKLNVDIVHMRNSKPITLRIYCVTSPRIQHNSLTSTPSTEYLSLGARVFETRSDALKKKYWFSNVKVEEDISCV